MKAPVFYDPATLGSLNLPKVAEATDEGRQMNLAPATGDKQKVILVNVDFQVDFVFPNGALPVTNALGDVERTVDWIFRNLDQLTTIASSIDSHIPVQIFYPTWWVDANGNMPDPYTMITLKDVEDGKWKPVVDPVWTRNYLTELDRGGKKTLMIWPFHCMIGTPGQALVPNLMEAIAFHSAARRSQPVFLVKGSIPQTENYSIVEPEVKYPKHPAGDLNTPFLDLVSRHDLVYVAGEAKSHCVLDTMRSIVNHFAGQDDILGKIRFLMDCTSSVEHPDVPFDEIANAELAEMEKLGVRLVKSTDPIG